MAKYCAAHICDVVKDTEAFKEGNLGLGLKQTFLKMDDMLRTPAGQVRRVSCVVSALYLVVSLSKALFIFCPSLPPSLSLSCVLRCFAYIHVTNYKDLTIIKFFFFFRTRRTSFSCLRLYSGAVTGLH